MATTGNQRLRRDFGLEGKLPGRGTVRRLLQVSTHYVAGRSAHG